MASVAANTKNLCPPGIQSGIVQLSGPLTTTILENISVNGPPFTASFAPRSVQPQMIGAQIEEDPNNTILFQGTRYSLTAPVQICTPLHTGYPIPGQTQNQNQPPVLELVVPFINTQVIGTYPAAVFCIFPIYVTGSASSHAAYIQQLLSPDNPVAAIQTLFFEDAQDDSQVSFSYASCIDLAGNGQNSSVNCRFFVFPNGIVLANTDFVTFGNLIKNIQEFAIPSGLIGFEMQTVTETSYDTDGNKIVVATSPIGNLPFDTIPVVSQDFTHRIQFFTKPPQLTADFNKQTCPYYKTTEYKCVPFDKLRDLSGNQVIPNGVGLNKVLEQTNNNTSDARVSFQTSDMWEWLIIIVSVIGGLSLFCWVGGLILRWMQSGPDTLAVAAAAATNTVKLSQ